MISKKVILVLILFSFSKINSQKIAKSNGEIKITKIGYFINKKNKKKRNSKSKFYFDNFGKILEKIEYGRHHFNRLNVIGKINQFFYEKNKLIMIVECDSTLPRNWFQNLKNTD